MKKKQPSDKVYDKTQEAMTSLIKEDRENFETATALFVDIVDIIDNLSNYEDNSEDDTLDVIEFQGELETVLRDKYRKPMEYWVHLMGLIFDQIEIA